MSEPAPVSPHPAAYAKLLNIGKDAWGFPHLLTDGFQQNPCASSRWKINKGWNTAQGCNTGEEDPPWTPTETAHLSLQAPPLTRPPGSQYQLPPCPGAL